MKLGILLLAFIGYVQAISYSNVLESEWKNFKLQYERIYEDELEDELRRQIFMDNKEMIDRHNKKFRMGLETYEMGVNQFTDLLPEEFQSQMLIDLNITEFSSMVDFRYTPPYELEIPDSIDWRAKGAVTPVRNQGKCGSCWAFSTVGAVEGQQFIKSGHLVPLSEQNLLDCTFGPPYNNHGCDGGLPINAMKYILQNGGIDTEASYPYVEKKQDCKFNKKTIGAKIRGIATANGESALAAAVARFGPVSVGIDAAPLMFYKRGVINSNDCNHPMNHAVVVVGYGRDTVGGDYWLVKNSWGVNFGEDGYVRMSRNRNNQCHIASDTCFPLM